MPECSRCGEEITNTYHSDYYNCMRGMTWRTNLAYAKINVWQPEQGKSAKPETLVLCRDCYKDFVDFLE